MSDSVIVPLPFLSSRKLSDPFNPLENPITTYEFRVDTRSIPDLPTDANARPSEAAKLRRVYKSVRNAALDGALDPDEGATPGLFGYKHLGINVIAERVEETDKNLATLHFKPGQGVMNGGHGLAILRELQQDPGAAEMPPNFVKVTVIVGLPNAVIPEVAGANNTSVQVKAQSLLELKGAFEPLKDVLKGTRLENDVQWREGDVGRVKVDDIIAAMTCFRSDVYTIGDRKRTPHNAYAYKTGLIDDFRRDLEGYHALAPRLTEILEFQDYVRTQPKKVYNENGGRFGGLKFVDSIYTDAKGEKRKKPLPPFVMPFTGEEVEHRLNVAAVFPILAAFRQMISRNGNEFEWVGGFSAVKELWDSIAIDVMDTTKDACQQAGYVLNALGKSRSHWENVQRIVQIKLQDQELEKMRAALKDR
ncbi:AIPR family protein [Granulicella paludicola]|uniref:AIPR family protein n=1 Tax=Granulicella paludicola TaxID=474951 RepID=UPI0021E0FA80|nr:AIPR family protein [Granulicella paludicola]